MNEVLVLSNPRRRGGHRKGHRRGYRRNPIMGLSVSNAVSTLKDGALGAVGGLLNDAAYGYSKGFLPAALQAGYGRVGAKLALAMIVGFVANKLKPGVGRAIGVGAATVVLHEAGKELINAQAPSIPLGDYENAALLGWDSAPAVTGTGAYMNRDAGRVGAYMPGSSLNGDMLPP